MWGKRHGAESEMRIKNGNESNRLKCWLINSNRFMLFIYTRSTDPSFQCKLLNDPRNNISSGKKHFLIKSSIFTLHFIRHSIEGDMHLPTYATIFVHINTQESEGFFPNLVDSRHFLAKGSRLSFEPESFDTTTVYVSVFTKQWYNGVPNMSQWEEKLTTRPLESLSQNKTYFLASFK